MIHDSCSEVVWAVVTSEKGISSHVKTKVVNIIRGFVYSEMVIKSDQEPSIRSMGRNVVTQLFEDDFRKLCG